METMEILSLHKILSSIKYPKKYIMLENFTSEGRSHNETKLLGFNTVKEAVDYIMKHRTDHLDLDTLNYFGGINEFQGRFKMPVWENEDWVEYIVYKGNPLIVEKIIKLLEKTIAKNDFNKLK